ncbi:hypothetical protein SAMN05443575_4190 [Jatrophihabitans endophyticus]|uniref:Uncharacterized protein n=1 Tax=Jatrophihabitans endophyticus TaxID=1206085 RepID=A0A1M5UEI8_9ACTN|nr:hypothetical protein [Jatrophihabitans endophyticus]SHH61377.1 hypothetical protein SAMN05443575_4190 [Jatrophihabitans endophyticus]
MPRPIRTLGVTAVLLAGTCATLSGGGAPAGAAKRTCTAWASPPAKVALTSHTTIRPQLRGSSGCDPDTADGGATASLTAPGQRPYAQRWEHFGDRETIELDAALDPTGRYAITDGHAQVYDAQYRRVPSSWRTTTTTVRYAARFVAVSSSRHRAQGTLKRYGSDGYRRAAHVTVALQRHTADGWTTIARATTSARGTVGFDRALPGSRSRYRLVSHGSKTVWRGYAQLADRG